MKTNQKKFKKPNIFFNPRLTKIQQNINKYNYNPRKRMNFYNKIHKETIPVRNSDCNNFSTTFSNLFGKLDNESFIRLKESFFGEKYYSIDSFFSKDIVQDKINATSSASQLIKNNFYPKFTSTPFTGEKQNEQFSIIEPILEDDPLQISVDVKCTNNSFQGQSSKGFQNKNSNFLPTHHDHRQKNNSNEFSFSMGSFFYKNTFDLSSNYNDEIRSILNEKEAFTYENSKDIFFSNKESDSNFLPTYNYFRKSNLHNFNQPSFNVESSFDRNYYDLSSNFNDKCKSIFNEEDETFTNKNFKDIFVCNKSDDTNSNERLLTGSLSLKSFNRNSFEWPEIKNLTNTFKKNTSKNFLPGKAESCKPNDLNSFHFTEHTYKSINDEPFKSNKDEETFPPRSLENISSRGGRCLTCKEIRKNKKVSHWLDCNSLIQDNKSYELQTKTNNMSNNLKHLAKGGINKCTLPNPQEENINFLRSVMNSNSSKQYFIFYN
ncbi:putative uncharacterized protein DDB_G0282133 [Condylostylus longicornis]|uniref:putative uncharacterized protein DDB_G0282133 n=1 Tax=Condylostylus longicornis TaxID=2530218 RepID=UPI00244E3166|nr:putative uncharacterized protein DDB_G0282133 [Condylostylus longicornis]